MAVEHYDPDFNGLRGWLIGDEARALCTEAAEAAAQFARSIAPVGHENDPHPGAYRDSIHVQQAGLGGPKEDRVRVDVVADVPYAAVVEVQDGHHTLAKALDAIKGT